MHVYSLNHYYSQVYKTIHFLIYSNYELNRNLSSRLTNPFLFQTAKKTNYNKQLNILEKKLSYKNCKF